MNQKGIVLSGLIYALLVFFLLLLASFLTVLWYRQSAINNLGKDAHDIYDEVPIPFTTDFSYSEGVNVPKLSDGMTPIKWDGSAWVTTNESDPAWFDYKNKQWANARTADGSMWVWIPRYAYQITSGYHTNTAGVISVKFLIDLTNISADGTTTSSSPTYIADSQTNYITHPAFTFSDTELTGMWVAKFEPSVSDTSNLCYTSASAANCDLTSLVPKIVPNVYAWRYITLGNAFTVVRNMELNSVYGWGTTGADIDTHMTKNTEWGAIAYLAQSNFGKGIEEIWINPANNYTTGCAGDSASSAATTGCLRAYNTANGVKASTTSNIYGIYDISGGSWEIAMGNFNNLTSSSGIADVAVIESKYITRYGTANRGYDTSVFGDAVYETSVGSTWNGTAFEGTIAGSWNGDQSYMPYDPYAWFNRGGYFGSTIVAGPYAFQTLGGTPNASYSFRPILVVSSGL